MERQGQVIASVVAVDMEDAKLAAADVEIWLHARWQSIKRLPIYPEFQDQRLLIFDRRGPCSQSNRRGEPNYLGREERHAHFRGDVFRHRWLGSAIASVDGDQQKHHDDRRPARCKVMWTQIRWCLEHR